MKPATGKGVTIIRVAVINGFLQRSASTFRAAYGGLSRRIWLLSLAQLINRSGTMVVFFLSVYLRDELGFGLGQVGVVMALWGAGTLLGVFIGGKLIDTIGYYRVMIWSLLLGGALFILVSFIRQFEVLCIAMFLLSTFGEAFRPANMAAMGIYSTPETYTRSVAINRLAINLGFSIGPAIGGFLASADYRLVFWADGLTCFGAVALLVWAVGEKKPEASAVTDEPKASEGRTGRSPYKDKYFLFFLPLTSFYAIAFFQFFSTMPLYYKQVEQFSEVQIGWLMAINGLLVAGCEMILVYYLEKRSSLYRLIALGSALLVISYLALLWVGGWWWLLVLTIVISFSEMFAMPFMNTFMNSRAHESRRGQYASLYIMAWSSSQILTPLVATNVIAAGGYNALWIVLAVFALISTVGIIMLGKAVQAAG